MVLQFYFYLEKTINIHSYDMEFKNALNFNYSNYFENKTSVSLNVGTGSLSDIVHISIVGIMGTFSYDY